MKENNEIKMFTNLDFSFKVLNKELKLHFYVIVSNDLLRLSHSHRKKLLIKILLKVHGNE